MKVIIQIALLTAFLFILITLVTMKQEAAFDGFDEYGFLWVFFDYFEGKCDGCYNNYGFKPINFCKDIGLLIIPSLLIVLLINKTKPKV